MVVNVLLFSFPLQLLMPLVVAAAVLLVTVTQCCGCCGTVDNFFHEKFNFNIF